MTGFFARLLGTDEVVKILEKNVDLSTTIERDMQVMVHDLTSLQVFDRRQKAVPVPHDRRKANGVAKP